MSHSPSTLRKRGLLTIGFLALTGAILTAYSTPATGYELSLYSNTPLSFWVLFGCALFVALLVSIRANTDWNRRLALALSGISMGAFVGLPVLRGYRFYGAGDALTHLGWMRSVQSGIISPFELKYPALHTITTFFAVTIGIDLTQAASLVIVLLSCLFFLFVALSTSLVFESRYSTAVGAFGAFLLLPVTALSTYIVPHAMSQAIFFSAVYIYILLQYIQSSASSRTPSAVGVLFVITSFALVVFHPQLAAHLIAVFCGICIMQYLYRYYRNSHPVVDHRPIYGQSLALVVAFLAWTANHDFFGGVVEYAISSAVTYFVADGTAASSVNSKSESLAAIGGSVITIFLKLFSSSVVFFGLTGLLLLWAILKKNGTLTSNTNGLLPYFTISLITLAGIFGLYFFASYSEMYFRVFGLMMVFITITGSVTIAYSIISFSGQIPKTVLQSVVVVGFAIVLFLSLLTVFPSPYIYNASPHVTDMSMEGHEKAFETQDANVTFVGIRAGPNRHADAIHGNLDRTQKYSAITGEEIDEGITQQYSADRYIIITQADRAREIRSYQELRYSQSQLASISSQRGVNRIQSNGEFELFHIRGTAE
ncbi:hypothetical protein [Natrinema salsiterrestre]|uniref:hypothetical protein n=1 Tax=Natrinema salsiterrestre TaxID=2950540 RepID=UPI0024050668|nr:hypothetical protein [Natrinema salsiterrestre]